MYSNNFKKQHQTKIKLHPHTFLSSSVVYSLWNITKTQHWLPSR